MSAFHLHLLSSSESVPSFLSGLLLVRWVIFDGKISPVRVGWAIVHLNPRQIEGGDGLSSFSPYPQGRDKNERVPDTSPVIVLTSCVK